MKKYIIFFVFSFYLTNNTKISLIVRINDTRHLYFYKNLPFNSYTILLNSLATQGESILGGKASFLNGIMIQNGFSSNNTNYNINTNSFSNNTNNTFILGNTQNSNNITINGLLSNEQLNTYLIIDSSGMVYQKTITNKKFLEDPSNINSLYLTNIAQYQEELLTITGDQQNQLTINSPSQNYIQILGNNILLNFNSINSIHDAISFLCPVNIGNNILNTDLMTIPKNITINNLTTTGIVFTANQDLSIEKNDLANITFTSNGINNIDGTRILFLSTNPIAFFSQLITLTGLNQTNNLNFNFLTLDNTNQLCQTNEPEINNSFININSSQNTDLNINATTSITMNNQNNTIIINGTTIFLNGNINSSAQNMIFNSIVVFNEMNNSFEKQYYLIDIKIKNIERTIKKILKSIKSIKKNK